MWWRGRVRLRYQFWTVFAASTNSLDNHLSLALGWWDLFFRARETFTPCFLYCLDWLFFQCFNWSNMTGYGVWDIASLSLEHRVSSFRIMWNHSIRPHINVNHLPCDIDKSCQSVHYPHTCIKRQLMVSLWICQLYTQQTMYILYNHNSC